MAELQNEYEDDLVINILKILDFTLSFKLLQSQLKFV